MAAAESEAMSTVCVAHLGDHLDRAATAVEALLAKAKGSVLISATQMDEASRVGMQ